MINLPGKSEVLTIFQWIGGEVQTLQFLKKDLRAVAASA